MKILENKTAIITGAGSGMGKAMAILFAKEGANVIVADLKTERVDSVVNEIISAGGKSTGVTVNVSNEEDVKKMCDTAVNTYGGIDILVNNAGVMDDFTPVGDVTNDLWNKVIGVNLNGPFYSCRIVVPLMMKKGKGVIINISSIGGLNGARAGAAYTASKHAINGLTKNIAYMYGKKGIRCNAIAPGGVLTNIMEGATPNAFGYERMSGGFATNIRMAEPNEIADLALYLSSEKSSFVNGSVIVADGGWTAY
ncbi:3-ketoacyl-ACP reductase [Bacteroidota bacterium]|nr:3-ketoacyl-ACP reductase [Bacteroidota bacterium]